MPIGSDNPFPSVLLVEGTTPSSPAAGRQRMFMSSADSKARLVNSSGAVKHVSQVVQKVNTQTGAVATGTTTIPVDDTIPQNTEGTEFVTLAITPTSATNKLQIDVTLVLASSALATLVAALFQDSTANALAAVYETVSAADNVITLNFRHYMDAGTTSATTFKVRVGPGSAATVTFNGVAGGRIFGGVMASSITITEIVV